MSSKKCGLKCALSSGALGYSYIGYRSNLRTLNNGIWLRVSPYNSCRGPKSRGIGAILFIVRRREYKKQRPNNGIRADLYMR
jgi:hypothetical protein